jgi:hypothetical protein
MGVKRPSAIRLDEEIHGDSWTAYVWRSEASKYFSNAVIDVENLNLFAMNLGALKKYPDTRYSNYADVENTGDRNKGWPKVEDSDLK